MRIPLLLTTAALLFAACGAPAGNKLEDYSSRLADCICPSIEGMAKLADEAAKTADEAAKAALMEQIDKYPKAPCGKDFETEEKTLLTNEADKIKLDSFVEAALKKKCGEAAKKLELIK